MIWRLTGSNLDFMILQVDRGAKVAQEVWMKVPESPPFCVFLETATCPAEPSHSCRKATELLDFRHRNYQSFLSPSLGHLSRARTHKHAHAVGMSDLTFLLPEDVDA